MWKTQGGLLYTAKPGESCEDLESKSPTLWVRVVSLKQVDLPLPDSLPLLNWLFDPLDFRKAVAECSQEGAFAAADVSLD